MSIVAIRAALESALDALPGILPEVGVLTSVDGVYATDGINGLVPGLIVTINGHSGTNGTYQVGSISESQLTFTIIDTVTGQQVSSSGTGGTVKAELTAWENMFFPVIANRVPYQKVNLMASRPENPTMGSDFHREIGIMQITLVYPLQQGTRDAFARAELIRSAFPRGASFSSGGVAVQIDKTPEICSATISDEAYMLPVLVFYYANIHN